MALAIDPMAVAQVLPTSSDLLAALQNNQSQAQDAPLPTKSKGKLLSKDAPTITSSNPRGKISQFGATSPITPITPPASDKPADLIDLIAAMMVAVQAMELCLSKLMTDINTAEASMRTDAANAMAYSEKQNIAAAIEAAEKAAAAEKISGIMKILGYIAAAIVCVVSVGTLIGVSVALLAVVLTVTILDATGVLQKGIDAMLGGIDPNSTLGKVLELVIKVVIMVVIIAATSGAGAAVAAPEAADAGAGAADAGADVADASADAADAGADAANGADDAADAGADGTKAAEDAKAAKSTTIKQTGKMLAANIFASTNPLGDLSILCERAVNKGKANADVEQWIEMATAIISGILGMVATFSAGNALSSVTNDTNSAANIGKAISVLNKLSTLLNLTSAALGGYIAELTHEKAQAEKREGQLIGTNDELKSLIAALKTLTDETHQWMKQITATDAQLTNSMEFDEFQNFAHVQLHA